MGRRAAMTQAATHGAAGVLFDIDGTLVDTNYLHVTAWWQSFRDAGHDVAMSDIHRSVGMGSSRLTERLVGRVDDAAVEGHSRHYRTYFGQLRPFPDATALLRAVAGLGLRVVLATSAEADECDALTTALDADDALAAVTSSADADASKPAPDILEAAMERGGLSSERTVMVGDTVWDVRAAERAGVPCIGVLSGGISRAELTEAGAIAVYDDAAALLADLQGSEIGRLAQLAGSA